MAKEKYIHKFEDQEVELGSTVQIKCVETGNIRKAPRKYFLDKIAPKYGNNWSRIVSEFTFANKRKATDKVEKTAKKRSKKQAGGVGDSAVTDIENDIVNGEEVVDDKLYTYKRYLLASYNASKDEAEKANISDVYFSRFGTDIVKEAAEFAVISEI